MEDNTILIFLGVMLSILVYGAYNGLVGQYQNILLILLGAEIVYLFLLEIEFKQLKKIAFKMGDEESMLIKSVKELKDEVAALQQGASSQRRRS
jgi:hypothetical protein